MALRLGPRLRGDDKICEYFDYTKTFWTVVRLRGDDKVCDYFDNTKTSWTAVRAGGDPGKNATTTGALPARGRAKS